MLSRKKLQGNPRWCGGWYWLIWRGPWNDPMLFDSATPTSNKKHLEPFYHFFLHMHINTVTCTSVRILSSPSFSVTSISYKSAEMLVIWPRFLLILATFLRRMRRNAKFRASGYNSDNAVGFNDPDFL